MMDTEIYLVIGNVDYESSDPIKAFDEESSAKEFAEELKIHDKECPSTSGLDSDDDKSWDAYERSLEKWSAENKNKSFSAFDSYSIVPIFLEHNYASD